MSRVVDAPEQWLPRFGVAALRPGQRAAFNAVVQGRDVLVVLPTGGGKSLCYQLPAACGLAPAIVVSPLVALMKDQVDALRRRGVRAAQVSGAVSQRERDAALAALDGGALELLYLAPEALASPRMRERLRRAAPRLLAIDEAHCISEWGESFRPAYLALGAVRSTLGTPVTIALTATATPRTARDIVERLRLRDPVEIRGGFDRPNLHLRVRRVADEAERLTALLSIARSAPGPAVMYATTRRGTEQLAGAIRRLGIAAAPFHAGLPPAERARLQDRFQGNELAIIVATNAFGMGVDKPDVRVVAHAEPPFTLEAYYQEAGRGGRDGAAAACHLLVAPNDLARARRRLGQPQVSRELLRHLVSVLHDAGTVRGSAAWRSGGAAPVVRLSHALEVPTHDVDAALRLLGEDGALAARPPAGLLRVLAAPSRLQRLAAGAQGEQLARDAEAFLRLLVDAANGDDSSGSLGGAGADESEASRVAPGGVRIDARSLDRLAADGDGRRLLERWEAAQLAVWVPEGAPWRLTHLPSDESLARLAMRFATRQARNAWRHAQVARFVETTRCRRLVLLRYFGDSVPATSCGACDVCGFQT